MLISLSKTYLLYGLVRSDYLPELHYGMSLDPIVVARIIALIQDG